MKKFSTILLVTASILATAAMMWAWLGRRDLDEGGGAYAVSPDGRWLAEISDANSKVHKKSFAVIRVWDLREYPSLRNGVRYYGSKAPTVRLEFPQTFQARDEMCKVSWATNSTEVFIEFQSSVSAQTGQPLRRFRYDLGADVFSLSTAQPHKQAAEDMHEVELLDGYYSPDVKKAESSLLGLVELYSSARFAKADGVTSTRALTHARLYLLFSQTQRTNEAGLHRGEALKLYAGAPGLTDQERWTELLQAVKALDKNREVEWKTQN
jgi:hypothetical protein